VLNFDDRFFYLSPRIFLPLRDAGNICPLLIPEISFSDIQTIAPDLTLKERSIHVSRIIVPGMTAQPQARTDYHLRSSSGPCPLNGVINDFHTFFQVCCIH
jgi:hypothetical protein